MSPARRPAALVSALVGVGIFGVSFAIYWLSNRYFDAGRGDLFYLADAFLHGRTWIDVMLGPYDVIPIDGRIYVPFAPFPAIVLMPFVALVGDPVTADQLESGVNAFLAATVVLLAWYATFRLGVEDWWDRLGLTIVLGFSTAVWWVTTRGGVWHTGHLIAVILSLLLLMELYGARRPVLLGLLVGAAFLTRAPMIFAAPFVGLMLVPDWRPILGRGRALGDRVRALPWRTAALLVAGVAPALLFFAWYNVARFGSISESGYQLATLPAFLEVLRQQGLFSVAHIPMNLHYLFTKLPDFTPLQRPFFRPDGLGMSVFFTSPALLLALRADWRDRRSWLLLATAIAVLIPTLMYYGGGWFQYGYRYFLDSIPFVWALCVLGVVKRGPIPTIGWVAIWWGVTINAIGVYWAYNL